MDGSGQRRARACIAAAVIALAGCASDQADSANRAPDSDPWQQNGGQTGSLVPRCGLAPAAIEMGVPSSPAGFVVYARECNGALALGQLSVRDAQGRSIDFDVETLIGGAVLITPQSILPEGSYSVGSELIDISDDDAGLVTDVDAGIPAVVSSETLTVAPAAPRPTRLGELSRVRDECSPTFALQLDPSIEPYVSLLALDLQVDQGPLQPFIAYGTLDVTDGRALLTLRRELWSALTEGSHQLTLVARLAGEDTPLESITMAFEIDCYDESVGADEADVTCSVARAPRAPAFIPLGALIALTTVLLARRKRARAGLRHRSQT